MPYAIKIPVTEPVWLYLRTQQLQQPPGSPAPDLLNERLRAICRQRPANPPPMLQYDRVLTVILPSDLVRARRTYITNANLRSLHVKLREWMFEDMYAYLEARPRARIQDSIYDWMNQYHLCEDAIAMETLKKSYYRWRLREKAWDIPAQAEPCYIQL